MIQIIFLLLFTSLSAIADCGLVGSIEMRIDDCSHIKIQKSLYPVISFKEKDKTTYFYNEKEDSIIGPLFNNKCLRPYKKKKFNNEKVCLLKKASRYYLLGNEIEFIQ